MDLGLYGALGGLGKGLSDVGGKMLDDEIAAKREQRIAENVLEKMKQQSALNMAEAANSQKISDASWKQKHQIERGEALSDYKRKSKDARDLVEQQHRYRMEENQDKSINDITTWLMEENEKRKNPVSKVNLKSTVDAIKSAWASDNTTKDALGNIVVKPGAVPFIDYWNLNKPKGYPKLQNPTPNEQPKYRWTADQINAKIKAFEDAGMKDKAEMLRKSAIAAGILK